MKATSVPRGAGVVILQQAQAGAKRVVWGPASVEMESRDGKIITMSAIEEALPQLLRRAALSVLHKDQLVGEIHERLTIPPERAANDKARRLAKELGGTFRTGLHIVSQAIADVFPKLRPFIGTEQMFVAATLYDDNKTSNLAWDEVRQGKLDSFSISGAATEVEPVERVSADGRRIVERVTRMDLSAVTLASSGDDKRGTFTATARNPAAALVVIAQSEVKPLKINNRGTGAQPTIVAQAEHHHSEKMDALLKALEKKDYDAGAAHRIAYSVLSPSDQAEAMDPTCEACKGMHLENQGRQELLKEAYATPEAAPHPLMMSETGETGAEGEPSSGADKDRELRETLQEIVRRIEALETAKAEQKGAEAVAPEPQDHAEGEPAEEAEKPEDKKDPAAAKEGEDEEDPKEKTKMKTVAQANPPTPAPAPAPAAPVEQAAPAPAASPTNTDFASMLEQAFAKHVAPLAQRLDALEQARPAAAPAPTPGAARPSTVATPAPATPAAPATPGGQSALMALIEAADTGDTVAFREAMLQHGPAVFPNLKLGGDQ